VLGGGLGEDAGCGPQRPARGPLVTQLNHVGTPRQGEAQQAVELGGVGSGVADEVEAGGLEPLQPECGFHQAKG
jgi:hypothetical protein